MIGRGAHKDIQVSARVDGATNEQIDQLAAMEGVSHAEIVRRAVHLLAAINRLNQPSERVKIGDADLPRPRPGDAENARFLDSLERDRR